MELELLPDSDPRLRDVAKPIKEIDETIVELAGSMNKTMMDNSGIGIAAPQVGYSLRLIVVQMSTGYVYTMVNPEIMYKSSTKCILNEGCLSLPGQFEDILRPEKIRLKYTNLKGERKSMTVGGWDARVILHEVDHLDGILFTDYLE